MRSASRGTRFAVRSSGLGLETAGSGSTHPVGHRGVWFPPSRCPSGCSPDALRRVRGCCYLNQRRNRPPGQLAGTRRGSVTPTHQEQTNPRRFRAYRAGGSVSPRLVKHCMPENATTRPSFLGFEAFDRRAAEGNGGARSDRSLTSRNPPRGCSAGGGVAWVGVGALGQHIAEIVKAFATPVVPPLSKTRTL